MDTNVIPTSKWVNMVTGVQRRTLATGRTMMQMIVKLDSGSHLPEHQHPHEQIAHVLSGKLSLTIAGVAHELNAGDSFYIASNVPHAADALEDTTVIDTFSPSREDLLAQDAR